MVLGKRQRKKKKKSVLDRLKLEFFSTFEEEEEKGLLVCKVKINQFPNVDMK